MTTQAQTFATAALADIKTALATSKTREGPAFNGSSNCLANIERDYARRNRGHWFDKDSVRYFGTRYNSGFLDVPAARVTLFVTTEKPPHGPRAASLRVYLWDAADVDTAGPFCTATLRTVNAARDLVYDALVAEYGR